MKTIYKYEVKPGEFTVEMPANSQVLTVQAQYNSAFIWALVDTDNLPIITRRFFSVPTGGNWTGHPHYIYVGTFQLEGGTLVFHLFEAPT